MFAFLKSILNFVLLVVVVFIYLLFCKILNDKMFIYENRIFEKIVINTNRNVHILNIYDLYTYTYIYCWAKLENFIFFKCFFLTSRKSVTEVQVD